MSTLMPQDPSIVKPVADVAAAVGGAGFHAATTLLLCSLADAEVGIVLQYFSDQRPRYLHIHADAALKRGASESRYINGAYVLDPVYQMFRSGQADGACAMSEYAAEDFYDSEFYAAFFRNTQLIDTIDVFWRVDEGSSVVTTLGREQGQAKFAPIELERVRQWLPVVFAAARRHFELVGTTSRDKEGHLVDRRVQLTLQQFGTSLLTRREREVLLDMLYGFSARQTALRLDMAEGTARIHRKSIHRKLNTASLGELFSLFIRCMAYADPDNPSDPLLEYDSPRAPSIKRSG
jgi:DNA-binding CsgD family transcriptional regulator